MVDFIFRFHPLLETFVR